MDSNRSNLFAISRRTPFPQRPWMENSGAAAAAGGSTGLKGIFEIAQFVFCFCFESMCNYIGNLQNLSLIRYRCGRHYGRYRNLHYIPHGICEDSATVGRKRYGFWIKVCVLKKKTIFDQFLFDVIV